MDLGRIGIWQHTGNASPELVAEAEGLGYGTYWIGGSPRAPLSLISDALDATSHIVVATGIVNMWADDPGPIADAYHRIQAKHPDRFLLGVGIGHPEATKEYKSPYETMVDYLDALDAANVPKEHICLAALGPKVLRLAADRTRGAHPYLTDPGHTAQARGIVGDALLAPEHKVVLTTDAEEARSVGRKALKMYLGLINYRNNWLRHGWTEEDLADGGSDRFIDTFVLYGETKSIAARLTEHLDAGADHVCIQVLGDLSAGHRALAAELL